MYAVVREVIPTPGQEVSTQEHEQGANELMSVPGFLGQLTVDTGDGKLLIIRVWESGEKR